MALPYPTVTNCIRCNFKWFDGSGHYGSRFFLAAMGAPWVAPDLNTLAGDIATTWNTNLAQDISNGVQLVEVDTRDLTATDGAVGLWQGSHQGQLVGSGLPSNAAMNIRSIIADHYRGGHAVLHHPPGNTGQLQSNRLWTGTYASGVTSHWTAFVAALEALSVGGITTVTHVVLRGYKQGAVSANVIKWPPINYVASTKVGTMRRRLSTEA